MTPRKLSAFCLAFYLASVLLFVGITFALLHGHFVYPLDDSYIHLALAEQIAHGHYGINPSEAPSPSSSVLWPLLLVPFAGTRLETALPLLWNTLFGAIAASLIGRFTVIWTDAGEEKRATTVSVAVTALLLIFSGNLIGLTLLGMEHMLQVLLAVCVAIGVAESFAGRNIPWWSILAAGFAPAVRYESLSLTAGMAIALVGARRFRTASGTFLCSLLPLAAFAFFLHHLGLPALPESVLVKGSVGSGSAVQRFLGVVGRNLEFVRFAPLWRVPLLVLTSVFAYLFIKSRQRQQRFALAAALCVCVLQFLFGQFNWFHRYEVFAVVFVAMLVLPATAAHLLTRRVMFGVLCVSASAYVVALLLTPFGSRGIYLQQAQMHRFTTAFYHGNVAINDLGMVSYRRSQGTYVLDLFGLASPEAAAHPTKQADWLVDVTQRKQSALAMIYPDWFQVPPSWVAIGKLCEHHTRGTVLGEPCVVFFSTQPGNAHGLRQLFRAFAQTVPDGSIATVLPDNAADPLHGGG